MFLCSAVNNMLPLPARKDLLRRIDQSAIYVKIAGSYTPFAVLTGTHAGLFLAGRLGRGAGRRLADHLQPGAAEMGEHLLYLAHRLGRRAVRRAADRRADRRPASR